MRSIAQITLIGVCYVVIRFLAHVSDLVSIELVGRPTFESVPMAIAFFVISSPVVYFGFLGIDIIEKWEVGTSDKRND